MYDTVPLKRCRPFGLKEVIYENKRVRTVYKGLNRNWSRLINYC